MNSQFLWPVYCSKVWLKHIKISAQLHVIEAQEKYKQRNHKMYLPSCHHTEEYVEADAEEYVQE